MCNHAHANSCALCVWVCHRERERERELGLHHWVRHPTVRHLPAQAVQILHLSLDPGGKNIYTLGIAKIFYIKISTQNPKFNITNSMI